MPRLLVIHLKRFSGGMEKINSYIPTPFELHCFCNRCIDLPADEKLHIYKLYSVITHVGATMSVGHYVAYTCSLDIQNEYRWCPNERTKLLPATTSNNNNGSQNGDGDKNTSRAGAVNSSNGEKNPRSIKRLIFGNKKANSSGDISKNFKGSVNGLVSKVMTNGMEKLSLNTGLGGAGGGSAATCQGVKCCGIHVKNSKLMSNNSNGTFVSYLNGHLNGDTLSPPALTKPSSSDLSIASTNSNSATGHTSHHLDELNGGSRRHAPNNINQDYWYMCDDDKIKVMTQQQFEEYLSPNRKNMITPYLLFYARFDQSQT